MTTSDRSFTPTAFRLLAVERGVDIACCFEAPGLMNEDFDKPDKLITVAQCISFGSCVVRKINVERAPGRLFKLIWNLGAGDGLVLFRFSRSMLDMLQLYTTYGRIFSVAEVELKLSETTVEIIQRPANGDEDFASISFVNLLLLMQIARMAAQVEINPSDVTLAFAPQNDPDLADFLPDVEVKLGSVNAMTFPLAVAKMPFLTEDRQMINGLFPQFERRLAMINGHRDLVEELRSAIREDLSSGDVRIGKMANLLGVGTRTLQRRLNAAGTKFSQVVDEERRDLVQTLLARGRVAKAEIAFRVGYRDINSLYRALSRWRASGL